MRLSLGKRRRLAQSATDRGVFSILALDHRNNLYRAFNPEHPETVPKNMLGEFKAKIVQALAPFSSAVLLDPELGAAPAISGDVLPGQTGLIMALEATGYSGNPIERSSKILPGWSAGKICRMGASGVKLLVYYHPESPQASCQEDLVASVAESCKQYDLPLFLEPLSYSLDPDKKLSSAQKRDVVIKTADRLTSFDVDVLKVEFPLDVKTDDNENSWVEACEQVSSASSVPWVLLSAGVGFETYLRQVVIACQAGASGVMAGRAVWKEAVGLQEEALQSFLAGTARARMTKLTNACNSSARPWMDFYPPQEPLEDWYLEYPDI